MNVIGLGEDRPSVYGEDTLDHHRLMNAATVTAVKKKHPGGFSIIMAPP
ncbi:hypothetical protein [Streptosporangium amethystogenes]|nr:hypothetical protein [Streptosporangium amethystogenes]